MNLGKQVISAGAESVGLFSELATLTAEQRSKLREVMQTSCEIQGSATLQDGQAQKAALDDEADMKGTMAIQSFIEAGTTASSEVVGMAMEGAVNKLNGATKCQENLSKAEALETKLNGGAKQDLIIKGTTPGHTPDELKMVDKSKSKVNSEKNKTSSKDVELDTYGGNQKARDSEESEATQTKKPDLNDDQLKNLPLSLKNENGDMKDLGDEKTLGEFTEDEHKALNLLASDPDHPKAIALRKQVSKAVKRYQKQVDSKSASAQRAGNFTKEVVRAANLTAKGCTDMLGLKKSQEHEADQKLLESQARYLSDTNGSLMRQAGEVAGNLTNHIQNINQARKEMFESNRA